MGSTGVSRRHTYLKVRQLQKRADNLIVAPRNTEKGVNHLGAHGPWMINGELKDRFENDVYKLDLREAIYRAGMENLDDAEDILRKWGANL